MNILTDDWLPVRLLEGGTTDWISLETLLTGKDNYEICLPRDDLEMAALQLLICIVQVLFAPATLKELVAKIKKPLSVEEYSDGIAPYREWFELEHLEYPFMQVRGVIANKTTPIHRLLPGLADATNSCFVNERGISDFLCAGCVAIALFNRASNSPSFGGGNLGGFKPGLRGSTPISTLVQGRNLREMVWLNVLTKKFMPADNLCDPTASEQEPTWVSKIQRNSTIEAAKVGLLRGLFWQPALVELAGSNRKGTCNLCGRPNERLFNYFLTNQFGYTFSGFWPHPHSPVYLNWKNESLERRFASFKNSAPSWTELARFIIKEDATTSSKIGQEPSAIMIQAQELYERYGKNKELITLAIGGYRNEAGKSASIGERKHELICLGRGWATNPLNIDEIVQLGLKYKSALIDAVTMFDQGKKNKKNKDKSLKGTGFSKKKNKFFRIGEAQFYRRTDGLMQKTLAEAEFENPEKLGVAKDNLRAELKRHCIEIFEEQTSPYLDNPSLIKTMAVARRLLYKNLKMLEPGSQGDE